MKQYKHWLYNTVFCMALTGGLAQANSIEALEARLLNLEQEAARMRAEINVLKQNSAQATAASQTATTTVAQTATQQQPTQEPMLTALNLPIRYRPANLGARAAVTQTTAAETETATTAAPTITTAPAAINTQPNPNIAASNTAPIVQNNGVETTVAESTVTATQQPQQNTNVNNNTDSNAAMPMELLLSISQVQSGKFDEAQRALEKYVTIEHNQHQDRAYYWLGEATYRQNDFEAASRNFTQSYLKNPKGQSAPDALIRLGMSLSRIDKKDEACKVLDLVSTDFPTETIKTKIAQDEKSRIQCP